MPGAHVLPDPKRYTVEPMTGLEVYKIGREAIITLQPSTGYVAVSCAWHPELNGCHWWNSRGAESLHRFLVGLNRHYTMKKLFGRHALEEYDEDQTKAELRKLILDGRRDGYWSSDEARDLWDQVDAAESADDIARMTGLDCPYECIRYKPKSCADWFWSDVWSAFIAHIRMACLPNTPNTPPAVTHPAAPTAEGRQEHDGERTIIVQDGHK